MAIDRKKLEDLLKELPEQLQNEVLQFAESLLQRNNNTFNRERNATGAFFLRHLG